jgi:hypothetical protein
VVCTQQASASVDVLQTVTFTSLELFSSEKQPPELKVDFLNGDFLLYLEEGKRSSTCGKVGINDGAEQQQPRKREKYTAHTESSGQAAARTTASSFK